MAFVKIYASDPLKLVCFFEGKDFQYFCLRIRLLASTDNWEHVVTGGKAKVLKLHRLITEHDRYKSAYVAFFVDRDFGLTELPEDPGRIYCTPCYSVENLYVTTSVFTDILNAEFALSKHPDDGGHFSRCVDTFSNRLKDFVDRAVLINSWIFAHRDHETKNKLPRGLNADLIKVGQLINVELDSVSSTYSIFDLEAATGCTSPCSEGEIEEIAKAIAPAERHAWIRGKLLSFFMREFLSKLAKDARLTSPNYFPSPRKFSLQLSSTNFLSELSQYAETPPCLEKFIQDLGRAIREPLPRKEGILRRFITRLATIWRSLVQ